MRDAIRDGPVKYAGGSLASGGLFEWKHGALLGSGLGFDEAGLSQSTGAVRVRGGLWREFALMGGWIADSLLIRWAELTAGMTGKPDSASGVLALLIQRPAEERSRQEVHAFFEKQPDLECTWSGVPLTGPEFVVDHVIPFALWRRSDYWNLLPADRAVNGQKGALLASGALLDRRRDRIVTCWEALKLEFEDRFLAQVRSALAPTGSDLRGAKWKDVAWAGLVEAIETTAVQRCVARWEPKQVARGLRRQRRGGAAVRHRQPDRAATPGLRSQGPPLRIVPPTEVRPFLDAVPCFEDLAVAAGVFSDPNAVDESLDPETTTWVALSKPHRPQSGMFVARVRGTSMERVIPDGVWGLFRRDRGGTRVGRNVLIRTSRYADPDMGAYTLKHYAGSTKRELGGGNWEHERIVLEPRSNDPRWRMPIVLEHVPPNEFEVIAELVRTLG